MQETTQENNQLKEKLYESNKLLDKKTLENEDLKNEI